MSHYEASATACFFRFAFHENLCTNFRLVFLWTFCDDFGHMQYFFCLLIHDFFLTVFASAFYIACKCCKLDTLVIKINWRCMPCGVSIYVVVGSSVCILGGSIGQRGTCHQLSLT